MWRGANWWLGYSSYIPWVEQWRSFICINNDVTAMSVEWSLEWQVGRESIPIFSMFGDFQVSEWVLCLGSNYMRHPSLLAWRSRGDARTDVELPENARWFAVAKGHWPYVFRPSKISQGRPFRAVSPPTCRLIFSEVFGAKGWFLCKHGLGEQTINFIHSSDPLKWLLCFECMFGHQRGHQRWSCVKRACTICK